VAQWVERWEPRWVEWPECQVEIWAWECQEAECQECQECQEAECLECRECQEAECLECREAECLEWEAQWVDQWIWAGCL
jgi:hypothetical protein